jgi:DNA (cytosine-5)-methyltransferase 1
MSAKPRLLDLFCGAGGASAGYELAGFDVLGVDLAPQPNYPFEFRQADAIDWLAAGGWIGFDAIHASPPCQRYSNMTKRWAREAWHPDLIEPIRQGLQAIGLPYVIENVMGVPLLNPIRLCGSSFGLQVQRHRLFEMSDAPLLVPPCQHNGPALQVNGHPGGSSKRDPKARFGSVAEWREGMGISWMSAPELAESIPPAFTEWIGQRLIEQVRR